MNAKNEACQNLFLLIYEQHHTEKSILSMVIIHTGTIFCFVKKLLHLKRLISGSFIYYY